MTSLSVFLTSTRSEHHVSLAYIRNYTAVDRLIKWSITNRRKRMTESTVWWKTISFWKTKQHIKSNESYLNITVNRLHRLKHFTNSLVTFIAVTWAETTLNVPDGLLKLQRQKNGFITFYTDIHIREYKMRTRVTVCKMGTSFTRNRINPWTNEHSKTWFGAVSTKSKGLFAALHSVW